jgi:hypothetical protein
MHRQRLVLFLAVVASASPLCANTNSQGSDKIPALLPPRDEIGPDFWERNGAWPVVGGVAAVAVIGVGLWLLLRPRAPTPVPPAAQARHELEPLRDQPETGVVLSRVSQVFRHYVAAAFGLPAGELTTKEFCSAIAHDEQVGSELSSAMEQFLQECDQRKFAPDPPATPLGAVGKASELIEKAEARRAQLDSPANVHEASGDQSAQTARRG